MRKKFTELFIILLCLIPYQLAVAGEQKVFTVLVQDYEELPPYSQYKNGEFSGFNREVLDLFATSQGYQFSYVAYPVKRLFHEFVQGTGDFKYPENPKWASHIKKEANISYSDPVVEYINGVMVLPENKGNGLQSIKKLGLVAGWTPIGYVEEKNSGAIKIFENNSYEGLLKQAMLGRIDGAYSNVATSRYYLTQIIKQADALVFDPDLPHVRDQRSLASIKHPEIIKEFNAFLKSHRDVIGQLKTQYRVEDGVVNDP